MICIQFQEQIIINATAENIFSLYADVDHWSSWDHDVKSSSLEGAFETGAVGMLEPTSGPKATIYFTQIIPNQLFTVESKLPCCIMRFEHELIACKEGTQVIHRVTFSGFLSPVFGRLIGKQIRQGLPGTLQGLKCAAEKGIR